MVSVLGVADVFGAYQGYFEGLGGTLTPNTFEGHAVSILVTYGAAQPEAAFRSYDILMQVAGDVSSWGNRPLLIDGVAHSCYSAAYNGENTQFAYRRGTPFPVGENLDVELGAAGSNPITVRKIADSTDDGNFAGGGFNLAFISVVAGNTAAFRFPSIDVPQGATISSASLRIYTKGFYNNGPATIRGADENVTSLSGYADYAAVPKTTASASFVYGTDIDEPVDTVVTSIVQEIVSGTWASGNAIGLFIEEAGGTGLDYDIYDHQDNTSFAAELEIYWSTGGPSMRPWIPTDVGSLVLWIDPADATTRTDPVGGTGGSYADKSSNGVDFIQSSTGFPSTTTINGKSALLFDSDATKILKASGSGLNNLGNGANTIATIAGANDSSTTYVTFSLAAASGQPASRIQGWVKNSGTLGISFRHGGTSNFGEGGSELNKLVVATRNGTAILGYEEGVQTVTASNGADVSLLPDYITIGGGILFNHNGWVGDVVAFNAVISTDDRQKLEGYLAHKWGLESTLPSEHPYKSAAPTVEETPDPPIISTGTAFNNNEGSTLAIALAADKTIVTWEKIGGADQADFEISGTTLRWTGNGVQSYASPADSDTNNTYIVQIRATDEDDLTDEITITVTVLEVIPSSFDVVLRNPGSAFNVFLGGEVVDPPVSRRIYFHTWL